jgi:hypothetical protein
MKRSTRTRVGVAAVLAVALVVLAVSPAQAAPGYSTYPGSTWNVRNLPATGTVVGTISGSIPDLLCQEAGPAVSVPGFGTSTIYDLVRLPNGTLGYMSDLGVRQTRYAVFTPELPRCRAGQTPQSEVLAAGGYSYGWIVGCAAKVALGRVWSCYVDGAKSLFVSSPAY